LKTLFLSSRVARRGEDSQDGERGRKAVYALLGDVQAAGILPKPVNVQFAAG
jgi:hypothetical protein